MINDRFSIMEHIVLNQDKCEPMLCMILKYQTYNRNRHAQLLNLTTGNTFNVNLVELNKNIQKYQKLTDELKKEMKEKIIKEKLDKTKELMYSINTDNEAISKTLFTEEEIEEIKNKQRDIVLSLIPEKKCAERVLGYIPINKYTLNEETARRPTVNSSYFLIDLNETVDSSKSIGDIIGIHEEGDLLEVHDQINHETLVSFINTYFEEPENVIKFIKDLIKNY